LASDQLELMDWPRFRTKCLAPAVRDLLASTNDVEAISAVLDDLAVDGQVLGQPAVVGAAMEWGTDGSDGDRNHAVQCGSPIDQRSADPAE
jgi:hypothetical protein